MIHGFNIDENLICEGIVGDGCGGGRLFLVEDEKLIAYDPVTKEKFILLKGVKSAKSVSKKGCKITIESQKSIIEFDLSSMTKTINLL